MSNYDRQIKDGAIRAVPIILAERKAFGSTLQRGLGVSYAMASSMLDELARMGLIGFANGSRPREIYIDKLKKFNHNIDE